MQCRCATVGRRCTAPRAYGGITGYEDGVIARLGRVSDLIVVARKGCRLQYLFGDGAGNRPVRDRPAGVDGAGRDAGKPLPSSAHCWNGSREAARAVGFALPFLTECEGCVEIFAAPESKHHTDTQELLRYLSWHGIVGDRVAPADARATGVSLLAQGTAHQTNLIVMGAYTHGHYRQFLFGGVTRHVMQHAASQSCSRISVLASNL